MPIDRIAVLAAVQTAKIVHKRDNATTGNAEISHKANINMSNSDSGNRSGRYDTDLNGDVNILLGGAMMSCIIIGIVFMCYCCHKNIRKNRPQEYCRAQTPPDPQSLEVFTMDSQTMCWERAIGTHPEEPTSIPPTCPAVSTTPGPPPTYDSLIFKSLPSSASVENDKNKDEPSMQALLGPAGLVMKEDEGLPTYEAALKFEANGYV